ncbi:ATP synthase subunit b 2 [Bienertia sinuspersici]
MEGGRSNVGPPSNSNSHSRPVRASSRYLYGHSSSSTPATFCGPVRRWEKKWVHVSSSQSSSTSAKPRKFFLSNGPKSPDSTVLLCKWTPLSRPSSDNGDGDGDLDSRQLSRRKFRYTPITVFEEKKKLATKEFADEDKPEETDKSSAERPVIDGEDFYGLLDINNDFMGARQGTSEGDLIYTRRSHLNLGLHMENKNKDRQPDLNMRGLWATS